MNVIVNPADYGVTSTSKAHLTAWRKGYYAARHGDLPRNPYPDLRGGKYGHIVTGSRGYRNYWFAGYRAGTEDRAKKAPRSPATRSRKGRATPGL